MFVREDSVGLLHENKRCLCARNEICMRFSAARSHFSFCCLHAGFTLLTLTLSHAHTHSLSLSSHFLLYFDRNAATSTRPARSTPSRQLIYTSISQRKPIPNKQTKIPSRTQDALHLSVRFPAMVLDSSAYSVPRLFFANLGAVHTTSSHPARQSSLQGLGRPFLQC